MDLLDRYLHAVRQAMFLMPAAQKRDIIAELSDNLRSEFEAKQQEVGRPLTEREQEAILHRSGHPLIVAGRYRSPSGSLSFGRQLIGPELFPMYSFVLVFNASLTALVISIVLIALGKPFSLAAYTPVLFQLVIVTAGFMIADASIRRAGFAGWSPRTLRKPRDPYRISRFGLIIEIAGLLLVIGIWVNLPMGAKVAGSTWNDFASTYYLPLLFVYVILLVTSFINVIRPYWSRLRLAVRCAADTLFGAAMTQTVLTHWHEVKAQWIALAVPHPAVSKAILVTGWANISVTTSLAIAAIVCFAQALYELVLLIRWRPMRNGAPLGRGPQPTSP
jgi:hypothetical protein